MISSQRQHLILSRLRARGAVRITARSKELGCVGDDHPPRYRRTCRQGTVEARPWRRGDYQCLAQRTPVLRRVSDGYRPEGRAIAQEAIEDAAPGDVIAIGGGTTAYVFAQHLLESQQSSGITILTNSIPVAALVQALESKDVEVIVTGGVITRSNSLVGPIADKVVASLRVNTVFLGTHSVSNSPWLPDAEFAGSRNLIWR